MVKNQSASAVDTGDAGDAGDVGSNPGSGRSSRVGNGNLLQYSYLENFTVRGAWWASAHAVAKSGTQLKD